MSGRRKLAGPKDLMGGLRHTHKLIVDIRDMQDLHRRHERAGTWGRDEGMFEETMLMRRTAK